MLLYLLLFQKHSPYPKEINEKLKQLTESGSTAYMFNAMIPNASRCDTIRKVVASHDEGLVKFYYEDLETFFILISCGLAVAAAVFIFEVKLFGERIQLIKGMSAMKADSLNKKKINSPNGKSTVC